MSPAEKMNAAKKLLIEARSELAASLQSDKSRNRGATVRKLHVCSAMLGEGGNFFSQAGQDRLIDRVLDSKTGGVFVDVGGYDGVAGSNTLFFEMFRGWTGILIEPSPTQLEKAKSVRKCPCLGVAVAGSGTSDKADFMEITKGFTQMSGFLDSYDPKLLTQVRADPRHEEVIHVLSKKPLAAVLNEQKLSKIDFLSLDVEGSEASILESFPFADFDIDIITIENNTQNAAIPELMRDNGYDLIEFVGVDDVFRKRR